MFETPVSRLDLLYAITDQKTLAIDRWAENTGDKAEVSGHFYSDKAPGTATVALAPFAAARLGLRVAGGDVDSQDAWRALSWITCFAALGVPAALGMMALFAWLRKHVPQRVALVTVLALAVGGMTLPHATALWSHALVIGLVSLAVWALEVFGGPTGKRRTALAGFCLGLAVASEYTAGLVGMSLAVYALLWRKGHRVAFLAAAIPPLLLIPLYSWATVGTPFSLPYSYTASYPAMRQGIYAIKWPDIGTMGKLLFSSQRGLFFWSPFLLMAIVGWWQVAETKPRALWLTYSVPMVMVIVISGRTWDWEAGQCLGPRYLAPILPLLALPCAFGVERFKRVGVALAAVSIILTTLATLTNAVPPKWYENPLVQLHWRRLIEGRFSPNLGIMWGLPPYASVALFYLILALGIWWVWRQARRLDAARPVANHAASSAEPPGELPP